MRELTLLFFPVSFMELKTIMKNSKPSMIKIQITRRDYLLNCLSALI